MKPLATGQNEERDDQIRYLLWLFDIIMLYKYILLV